MKLDELLNQNYNEVTYWYKRLVEENNQENSDLRKMKVIYQNIEDSVNQVKSVDESYRTLYQNDLITEKTYLRYSNMIYNLFTDRVYCMRTKARLIVNINE